MAISIHALREEGDHYARYVGTDGTLFLSTPSARRATYYNGRKVIPITISIHALREEGDAAPSVTGRWTASFLSTPSARRATRKPTA